MKHALTIAAALALTLGALADEQSGTAAAPASTPSTATASAPGDSPLVAAAKRANRKGRKPAHVITNDTLNKTGAGAHVTTAARQRPFVMPKAYEPPIPTPEMAAAQARELQKSRAAEQEAAARKKAAEGQPLSEAEAAAMAEEGVYEDLEADPAQAEQAQEEANRKPPQE
jgi:hypothetical protein